LYIENILAVVTYTLNRREWASIDRALQTKKSITFSKHSIKTLSTIRILLIFSHKDNVSPHRRKQLAQWGEIPPHILAHLIILCFDKRRSKTNSVVPLKSNIFPHEILPLPNFGLTATLFLHYWLEAYVNQCFNT